jgi:hypothetical protein
MVDENLDIYNYTSVYVFLEKTVVDPVWYYKRPIYIEFRGTHIESGT